MSSNISDKKNNGIKRNRTGSESENQINPSFEIETKDIKVKFEKETKEWFNVMEENNDLSNKIKALVDQITSKDLQIKDMNIENEGLINKCKIKNDQLQTWKQLNRKMANNLNQLREKNKALKSAAIDRKKIIKGNYERIQNLKTTGNKLKTLIEEQKKMIDENERTFESLTDENKNFKTECKTLEKNIKHLESEMVKIREMHQYFVDRNEMNKKGVSNAVHGIDMHSLYANELRQNGKNMIDVNKNSLEKIDNFVKQVMKESRIEGIQQLADTIENINEKNDVIAKKDKIEEKRTESKIYCGDCQKIFETTSDLKHHYTITHKKDLTKLSKNQIKIIEITLD